MEGVFEEVRLRSYLKYLALPVVFGVGLEMAGDFGMTPVESSLAMTLVLVCSAMLFLLHAFGRAGVSPLAYLRHPPRHPVTWGRLGAMALTLVSFSVSVFWVACALLQSIAPGHVAGALSDGPRLWVSPDESDAWVWLRVAVVLHACILAPVVEELFFRGWVLHRVSHKFGPLWGVLVSSLLFGLVHRNILGMAMMGILLAVLTLHTGALRSAITLHALNNLVAVLLAVIVSVLPGHGTDVTASDLRAGLPWAAALLAVSGLVLGVVLWRYAPSGLLRLRNVPRTPAGAAPAVPHAAEPG